MNNVLIVLVLSLTGLNALKSCSQNKCLNGGACLETVDQGFKCQCPLLYGGKICEKCLCFVSNSTCSQYGDFLCDKKTSSKQNL